MIITERLTREDSIAQELRAIEDKKKEDMPLKNNSRTSYYVVLGALAIIILAILL